MNTNLAEALTEVNQVQETFLIKKVAVLGAGVMGAQIAAHMANMNIPVMLFELAADGKDKNANTKKVLKSLKKLKPAPFATQGIDQRIRVANYDDDLHQLQDCDLVIEAIAENIQWKKDLYEKISAYLSEKVILASNTSGLSINELANILPLPLQQRFLGVHFFNPPRYMHLVELIPTAHTQSQIIPGLEAFLVSKLGKGVVVAKDTPNFIANRIGVFSLLATIKHADKNDIPFDIVDQITGKPLGRAKSGTFRTMDVVGLDVLSHVAKTMQDNLKDDPWHKYYELPTFIQDLINGGALGQKTRKGVYANKGKQVFDSKTQNYLDANNTMDASLITILKQASWLDRIEALGADSSPQAKFVYNMLMDVFHYCCYHLEDIADTARDVDFAMRWGFGWQQGPFEIMQSIGWSNISKLLAEHINAGHGMTSEALPAWVASINKIHNADGSWSPVQNKYIALNDNPVYQRQPNRENVIGAETANSKVSSIFENDHVHCWHENDGIAVLSFKTKMHTVNEFVLDSIVQACKEAEQNYDALVLWHPAPFSLGADLSQVVSQVENGNIAAVDTMIQKFQQASMALKHCQVPTVAAVDGMTLGGGCEFQMHCQLTVTSMESYIGLVEAGVGLLPAGGGLKELAMRANAHAGSKDIFPYIQDAFELTAMAKVSASGLDAKTLGLLNANDVVIANSHELLHVAKHQARAMAETNTMPVSREDKVKVAGKSGKATLMMLAINMFEGNFISKHDYLIAEKIAHVLCGGDVEGGSFVTQDWLLKLEREAFLELLQTEKTQQRIQHTLKTGKPLRN